MKLPPVDLFLYALVAAAIALAVVFMVSGGCSATACGQ
jgi:hypothetical protein